MSDQLTEELKKLEIIIESAATELKRLRAENESLKKKIYDYLSCCCSGCTRHNQNVMGTKCVEKKDML